MLHSRNIRFLTQKLRNMRTFDFWLIDLKFSKYCASVISMRAMHYIQKLNFCDPRWASVKNRNHLNNNRVNIEYFAKSKFSTENEPTNCLYKFSFCIIQARLYS